MIEFVKLTRGGDVAVVTIENPPVNALSLGVPEGIQSSIETAAGDESVRAIVVLTRIAEFEKRHGAELWSTAPLLRRLAEAGQTLESFDARLTQ